MARPAEKNIRTTGKAQKEKMNGEKTNGAPAWKPGKTNDGRLVAKDVLYPKDGARFEMPTTLSEVAMDDISDDERKRLVSEIRREYQRQYYQKHKEKAKEYQRQYNLTHKKKARGGRGKASFDCPRERVRMTFNTSDLMHSPVEKTVKMLEKIINGERMFTM